MEIKATLFEDRLRRSARCALQAHLNHLEREKAPRLRVAFADAQSRAATFKNLVEAEGPIAQEYLVRGAGYVTSEGTSTKFWCDSIVSAFSADGIDLDQTVRKENMYCE